MSRLAARIALLSLLPFALLAPTCGGGPTQAPAVIVGNYTLTYTLANSRRISRTHFEYTYDAALTNNQAVVATNAAATVSSSVTSTVVTDNALAFGNVGPGQTIPSLDTFVIEQDRTVPFDPNDLSFVVMAGTPPGGTAPPPPSGLSALPGDDLVVLDWHPDGDPLALYNVYRSVGPAQTMQLMTLNPLTQPGVQDTIVTNGTEYYYAVTTLIGGLESPLSEVVGVVPGGGTTHFPARTGNDERLSANLYAFAELLAKGQTPAQAANATRLVVIYGKLYLRHVTPLADAKDGLRRLTGPNQAGTESNAAISPPIVDPLDPTQTPRQWVTYESNASGASEIWKVQLDDPTTAVQLTAGGTSQSGFQPAWSPNGNQIAFIQRRRCMVAMSSPIDASESASAQPRTMLPSADHMAKPSCSASSSTASDASSARGASRLNCCSTAA